MRSSTGQPTSLAITAVALALLIPAQAARCALAGRPAAGPSLLLGSSEEKSAPLSQEQTLKMLQAGVPTRQIEAFARRDGVDFKVTPALERDLRKAGATEGLIQLLKKIGNGPVPAPPPAPADTPELSALMHTAEDALTRKDFAEAAKALKAVVAKQPAMPEAWFNLGYAYTGLHEPEEAVKAYQKTLELAPDLFPARLNLGILLMEQHQPQAALEHLQKATTLKPDHARAHLYYARALAQTGQPEAARKEFQEVTRLDSHLALAQFELAQLELQQKRPAEALAAFQQALAVDPKLVQAELGAALAAEALNDPPQAVAHFEKYLASRPDDVETQFHLARLYFQQEQNEKARDTLESIYHVKPDLPGLTAALGDVNARLKKLPEAEKYYRLAVKAQPGVVDLHRALGEILLKEQKFPEAEGEFRTALQMDSHNREAASGLATCIYFEERYPEAIPLLEQLARAPDPPPALFFFLATSYDHLRARKEALANYERFLELSKGQAPDQEWQAQQRVKLLRRMLGK
jgi:tetratricopeptide (TPR) repeat protein